MTKIFSIRKFALALIGLAMIACQTAQTAAPATATPLPEPTETATSAESPTITPTPAPPGMIDQFACGLPGEYGGQIQLTADETKIAVSTISGVSICDVLTHEHVTDFDAGERNRKPFAMSQDGTKMAIGSYNSALAWDMAANLYEVIHIRELSITSLAWSADGTQIAGANGNIFVWEFPGHRLLHQLTNNDTYHKVSWSRDGKWIASGSGYGNMLVWNAVTGTQVGGRIPLEDSGPIWTLEWSMDGKRLAAIQGVRVMVYDFTAQRDIFVLEPDASPVTGSTDGGRLSVLAWSPDGSMIALGVPGTGVILLDSTDGAELGRIDAEEIADIRGIAWGDDGNLLLTSTGIGILAWDAAWVIGRR